MTLSIIARSFITGKPCRSNLTKGCCARFRKDGRKVRPNPPRNNSRSQRVLWMLEELGVEYTVVRYERDAKTMLAPPALKEVHPLGRSPVIRDGDFVLAESGAILEYLVERYGGWALRSAARHARVRDLPLLGPLCGRFADDAVAGEALSRSCRRTGEGAARAHQRRCAHAPRIRRRLARLFAILDGLDTHRGRCADEFSAGGERGSGYARRRSSTSESAVGSSA